MDISSQLEPYMRKCKNIKSRKNPGVQCPMPASNGDFCGRHYRNPVIYIKPKSPRPMTRTVSSAAQVISRFWSCKGPLYRYRAQGPAANDLGLAVNNTELYSLEPVGTIPPIYRFSIYDTNKYIWMFDIRSICQTLGTGVQQRNPYTRDTFLPRIMDKLYARVAWLRKRRYQIIHPQTEILTSEQLWKQRVLDIFLKIETLGYYVNSGWFHDMGLSENARFYERLRHLWEWKLALTAAQRDRIVPDHATGKGLFYFNSSDYLHKSLRWWQTKILGLIEAFITRASDTELNRLGATYILMALTAVSNDAARALPWAVDAMNAL